MKLIRDRLEAAGFEIIMTGPQPVTEDMKVIKVVRFVFENRLYDIEEDGTIEQVYYPLRLEELASQIAEFIYLPLSESDTELAKRYFESSCDQIRDYLWFEGMRARGIILDEDSSPHNDGISSQAESHGNSWISGNRQQVLLSLKKTNPAERKTILSDMKKFFDKSGKAEEMRSILDRLEENTDRELSGSSDADLTEEKGMKEANYSGSLPEMVAFYALVDGMSSEAEEHEISGIHGPGYEETETVPAWFKENNVDMAKSISTIIPEAQTTLQRAETALGVPLEALYEEFGDDVPYLVYMQSAGHGVGFWDGSEAGKHIDELGGDSNANFYTSLSDVGRDAAYEALSQAGLVESSVAKGKIDTVEEKISSPQA